MFDVKQNVELPGTWRCPGSHVKFVNEFLASHTETFGTYRPVKAKRPEKGMVVLEGDFATFPPSEKRTDDHAVLCRANAPLVQLRWELTTRNIANHMLGQKNIGCEMLKQVRLALGGEEDRDWRCRAGSVRDLIEKLQTLLVRLRTEAASYGTSHGQISDGGHRKLARARDAIKSVLAICRCLQKEGKLSTKSLFKRLDDFARAPVDGQDDAAPASGAIVLSSVHRAKGLGFRRVYILQPAMLPLPGVMQYAQHWERRQELNVAYVAYTRSHSDLVFLRHVHPCNSVLDLGVLWRATHGSLVSLSTTPDLWVCEAAKYLDIELPQNVTEDILAEFVRAVRMKFRTFAKVNHPDKQPNRPPEQRLHTDDANRRMQRAQEAKDMLENWVSHLNLKTV